MKKLLFVFMVILASMSVSDAKNCSSLLKAESEFIAANCADWAVGYIEAYETYTGTELGPTDFSITFGNLMDHCQSTTASLPGLNFNELDK